MTNIYINGDCSYSFYEKFWEALWEDFKNHWGVITQSSVTVLSFFYQFLSSRLYCHLGHKLSQFTGNIDCINTYVGPQYYSFHLLND